MNKNASLASMPLPKEDKKLIEDKRNSMVE